ncbi:hypothetical protein E7X58_08150 [Streptomyces sp. A1499]|nr:hypothetical protein E7X58_08150 [Streptomyces sp. A1499]
MPVLVGVWVGVWVWVGVCVGSPVWVGVWVGVLLGSGVPVGVLDGSPSTVVFEGSGDSATAAGDSAVVSPVAWAAGADSSAIGAMAAVAATAAMARRSFMSSSRSPAHCLGGSTEVEASAVWTRVWP